MADMCCTATARPLAEGELTSDCTERIRVDRRVMLKAKGRPKPPLIGAIYLSIIRA